MTRAWTIAILLSLFVVGAVACGDKDDKDAPSTDEVKAAPPAASKKSPEKKPTDSDSSEADSKDTDTDTEKGAPDGGDDVDDGRVTLSDPPKIDEIGRLVSLLQKRSKELDLREREVTEREQMMSSLEAATMKQVDVLFKLKGEVSVLMERLGKDFEAERKVFAEKQQKEEALRLKKEQETKAATEAAAAKRQKLVQEMAEEREQRTVQLTAAIKGMRASSGAGMLASMDEMDAVAVLRQLGARQAAALLNNMQPEKAATLAEAMLGPKPTAANLAPEEPAPESAAKNENNEAKKP